MGGRESVDVLARFRAGTRRLQRPPWHALEDLRDPARRLCEVLRRRIGSLDAGLGRNARRHDRGGAGGQLPSQESRRARGHRRRRSDREFHSGDRHLHLPLHLLRQAEHDGARRQDRSQQRRRAGGLPGRRHRHRDRRQEDRQLLRHAALRQRPRRRHPDLHRQARRFHAAIEGHAGTARSEGSVRKHAAARRFSASPARPRRAK